MLTLSRKTDEQIRIGTDCVVTVTWVDTFNRRARLQVLSANVLWRVGCGADAVLILVREVKTAGQVSIGIHAPGREIVRVELQAGASGFKG